MGSSQSNHSEDDEGNNNYNPDNDAGNQGANEIGWWQSTANNMVILESAIYIIGHLWRIYDRTHNPDKDLTNDLLRPRESLFSDGFSYTSRADASNGTLVPPNNNYNPPPPPHPSAPDLSTNEPIVPENEAADEEVPDDDEENRCVICTTNRIKTVFLKCGHMALCLKCSREYASRELAKINPQLVCVICKQPATQIKQIFSV